MIEPNKPQVYFIYGIPESGRREILLDLIENGIGSDEPVLYFRPEKEPQSQFDEPLDALKNLNVVHWTLDGTAIRHGTIKAPARKIIFLAPGTCDPADAAEGLKKWTDGNQCQIARILTVVDCAFLSENEKALPWFNACIHFSDVVLLNRRENVSNKWIKDFETGYRKQYNPARFLLVKKGRVANPFEVLEPEARRLSLYFDELIPIEEDEFEDDAPEDIKIDKYIARLESGQRALHIPNIQKLLAEKSDTPLAYPKP